MDGQEATLPPGQALACAIGVVVVSRAAVAIIRVPVCAGVLALAVLVGCAAPADAADAGARGPGFTSTSADFRSTVRFAVTYAGSGTTSTVYHSVPPNVGGMHDTNDAHDSSDQRWSLRFRQVVELGSCSDPRTGVCGGLAGLRGAAGSATVAGRISHRHLDGLFADQDMAVSCGVRSGSRTEPDASLGFRRTAGGSSIDLTAGNPIRRALLLLPPACPTQGDSVDGILDDYFTPGFSFAPGYGAERWFTSTAIAIPLSVLHRSATITVSVSGAASGRPPRDCAVRHRRYEACATHGSWSGIVTFRALSG